MKAALYNGAKNIELTELETDVCGDNDILLKNIFASICGSDVAIYNIGARAERIVIGGEFGHEMVSEVVAVGKNVENIVIGDRVYPYPRLAIANKLGFETCNSRKEDLKAKATEIFGEARTISGPTANVAIYIDAVGVTEIIETFMAMAKIESRLIIIGQHYQPATINPLTLTHSRTSLIGSGGYEAEDVIDVMAMMESGKWHIESIITHEFPWEQLVKAFETAIDVNKALKVAIKY